MKNSNKLIENINQSINEQLNIQSAINDTASRFADAIENKINEIEPIKIEKGVKMAEFDGRCYLFSTIFCNKLSKILSFRVNCRCYCFGDRNIKDVYVLEHNIIEDVGVWYKDTSPLNIIKVGQTDDALIEISLLKTNNAINKEILRSRMRTILLIAYNKLLCANLPKKRLRSRALETALNSNDESVKTIAEYILMLVMTLEIMFTCYGDDSIKEAYAVGDREAIKECTIFKQIERLHKHWIGILKLPKSKVLEIMASIFEPFVNVEWVYNRLYLCYKYYLNCYAQMIIRFKQELINKGLHYDPFKGNFFHLPYM